MTKRPPKSPRQTQPPRNGRTFAVRLGASDAEKNAVIAAFCETRNVRRSPKVDPFDRLKQLASEFNKAAEPKREECKEALSRFLRELTDEDQKAIRERCLKPPRMRRDRKCRDELRETMNELRDELGPATKLVDEICEDERAWLDKLRLPTPPIPNKQMTDRGVAFLVSLGHTKRKARALVKSIPPDEELQRKEILAEGCTPELAEAAIAEDRRQRKWRAASGVVAPAVAANNAQKRERTLRKLAPQIAGLSDEVAQALTALLVATDEAATDGAVALQHKHGILQTLRRKVEGVCWVDGNNSGGLAWNDKMRRTLELVGAVADGQPRDKEGLSQAARDLAVLSGDAKALAGELERGRGKPRKPAVDAAVALKGGGLEDWGQVATLLDHEDLRLDPQPHTPANLRRAVRNRLRRLRADEK